MSATKILISATVFLLPFCKVSLSQVPLELVVKTIGEKDRVQKGFESNDRFFMIATIKNVNDSAVNFWIKSGSWTKANFLVNNPAIYLMPSNANSDVEEEIKLLPSQKITFYSEIKSSDKKGLNNVFKIGFIYYKTFFAIPERVVKIDPKKNNLVVIWSNEINLSNNLSSYEIDK